MHRAGVFCSTILRRRLNGYCCQLWPARSDHISNARICLNLLVHVEPFCREPCSDRRPEGGLFDSRGHAASGHSATACSAPHEHGSQESARCRRRAGGKNRSISRSRSSGLMRLKSCMMSACNSSAVRVARHRCQRAVMRSQNERGTSGVYGAVPRLTSASVHAASACVCPSFRRAALCRLGWPATT